MPDKATPGQKIAESPLRKARNINRVMDVSAWFAEHVQYSQQQGAAGGLAKDTDIIAVRNDTGSNLVRGTVVQLGAELLTDKDPFNPWFEGDQPGSDIDTSVWAILRHPLETTSIGEAQISGRCIVRVDIQDTDHVFAKPVNGSSVLDSSHTGPIRLMTSPSSTGVAEFWGVIGTVAPPPFLLGKLDGTLNAGGSTTMSVWEGTPNSESDGGENQLVYDWLLGSGESVSSGKKAVAGWINNAYYVIAAECE